MPKIKICALCKHLDSKPLRQHYAICHHPEINWEDNYKEGHKDFPNTNYRELKITFDVPAGVSSDRCVFAPSLHFGCILWEDKNA